MKWKPSEIGRFGFKVGHTFEMSWLTLWRRETHYDMDLFVMGEDDDAGSSTTEISFEVGDKIIAEVYDAGQLDTWENSYNVDTEEHDPFVWSLDIAAPDASLLFISHGKGGLPPKDQFDHVVKTVRKLVPDFGKSFPEIA